MATHPPQPPQHDVQIDKAVVAVALAEVMVVPTGAQPYLRRDALFLHRIKCADRIMPPFAPFLDGTRTASGFGRHLGGGVLESRRHRHGSLLKAPEDSNSKNTGARPSGAGLRSVGHRFFLFKIHRPPFAAMVTGAIPERTIDNKMSSMVGVFLTVVALPRDNICEPKRACRLKQLVKTQKFPAISIAYKKHHLPRRPFAADPASATTVSSATKPNCGAPF